MKINFLGQRGVAQKELNRVALRLRPKQRRETVLVRIQKTWLTRLKERAKQRPQTLSRLHDEIYDRYFDQIFGDG